MLAKRSRTFLGLFATFLASLLVLGSAQGTEPCRPGAILDNAAHDYGVPETRSLSRALAQGPDVDLTTKELRRMPGDILVSSSLSDSKRMMRGSAQNAGLIPSEVGAQLRGRHYSSFDDFRGEFWRTVEQSKYGDEFSPRNRALMARGLSPEAAVSQRVEARTKYELHHIEPIRAGGSVYDLSNLMIVTPRFHREVLNRNYHYGN